MKEPRLSTVVTNPFQIPGAYGVGDVNGSVGGAFDVYIKYPTTRSEQGSINSNGTGNIADRRTVPAVLFFNGFQSRYSWYSYLLDAVASWGFITVQYQIPALSLMSVEAELETYYDPMMSWIEQGGLDDVLGPVSNIKVDLNSIYSAGHSRGGKVASLVFTENDEATIRAAFLIDPVDSSGFAPISPENPSAVVSLAASDKKIAVVGAGIQSSCNPVEGNFEKFYDAGKKGSWKLVMNETSHSQFAIAGTALDMISDSLCGKGTQDRRDIANTVSASMVSWFAENGNTAPGPYRECLLKQFYAGITCREAQNLVTFTIKE